MLIKTDHLIIAAAGFFLSLVVVVVASCIFLGLQNTRARKNQLLEWYRMIFEKSPLPMWLFDTATLQFIEVNEAAVRHYGYTKDEFLQMTINDIRPAEDAGDVEQLVKNNAISGIFYEGNARHIKKGGELIYVSIESNLLELQGRKMRMVMATDVTGKLRSQQAVQAANARIHESEYNLRAMFQHSTDGFVLLDLETRIKIFNARAKDYLAVNENRKALEVGSSIFDYVEAPLQRKFDAVIRQVSGGGIVEFDRKYRKENGEAFWIKFTITPVYEQNFINGFCITGRDITARKRYIQTIERQNKILREIAWTQSHLVRAPLTRIMGLITLFDNCRDDAEREEIAAFLSTSAVELDDILHHIIVKSSSVAELSKL
jgi:PAS domain S-box-containing protein